MSFKLLIGAMLKSVNSLYIGSYNSRHLEKYKKELLIYLAYFMKTPEI